MELFGFKWNVFHWALILGIGGYFVGTLSCRSILNKFFKNISEVVVLICEALKGFIFTYFIYLKLPLKEQPMRFQSKGLWEMVGEAISSLVQGIQNVQYSALLIIVFTGLFLLGSSLNPFKKFKGENGIGITYGVFMALAPLATLCAVLLNLILFFIKKTRKASYFLSLLLLPLFIYIFYDEKDLGVFIFYLSIGFLFIVFLKHVRKIKRSFV
ncbi:MAG: glycerol-3-phosphate acyltransferase [Deltaproteobacteria bacterium]|nr:glycerol-3-phosphate acyltransferase [Deltaproteobacteria bacterium]